MIFATDPHRHLAHRAAAIRLVLTDCDGVLTDNGVYFDARGEALKRFSIRDGMGVERLRNAGIATGIVTGENSAIVARRAEKLQITELHLGIRNKLALLEDVLPARGLTWDNVAYIGDDVNDLDVLQRAGLSASPADGLVYVRNHVHIVTQARGGHGAFREFAEIILALRAEQ